jgi:hypothetical protein
MVRGRGGHAEGAGVHTSGFAASATRYRRVCAGWNSFYAAARERGIEVVNLTPDTGLRELPRVAVPNDWLLS